MEHKKATSFNSTQQPQEFVIDEYDDHCVLVGLLSRELEHVDIPADINGKPVTTIGDGCFFDCKCIKTVLIPNSIKEIGVQAFAMCKDLIEIELPDSITNIGKCAFRDCTGLKRIVMSANLKTLETGTFSFCYLSDDVEITLKEGLETIESRIFNSGGLSHFFTLRLPKSVKAIADGAFTPGINVITDLPYDEKWFEL